MHKVAIIGGSGAVGTAIVTNLAAEYTILDPNEPSFGDGGGSVRYLQGTSADHELLRDAIAGADFVVYLPTGAPKWKDLWEIDVEGLRVSLEIAADNGCKRLVYASSNHVVGMVEAEAHKFGKGSPYPIDGPARPDSHYGVAKSAGETLCRFASEAGSIRTSSIRIGTMRIDDDLDRCADEPYFRSFLGAGREC